MKANPNELNYETTQFEDLGFFIEYLVDNRLIGTKNVDENPAGKVGHESTETHIAESDIIFKRKKIKKGTTYQTRVYPLCGKVIKKEQIIKTEIMSKKNAVEIKEAPGYLISEKGTVTNNKTKKAVTAKDGKVRLSIGSSRKFFKVADLLETYFPASKEVEQKPEPKAKDEKPKASNKAKELKADSGKEKQKSGAQIIREAYDAAEAKKPGSFSVKDFAAESGIAYHRVWGAVKQHLARIEKKKAAKDGK
jgi:hypothetical protein